MRYSSKIKDAAIDMRKGGASLGEISIKLHVPRTTIQLWTNQIKLTEEQKKKLKMRALLALDNGRKFAQQAKSLKRLTNLNDYKNKGVRDIGKLSKRDLLIAGVNLYWAEGFKNKHEYRLGFCNSDPRMINLYILFLSEILNVKIESLTARATLNESYKDEIPQIQNYWSAITGIPLIQFTKPFFQKVIWKKEFADREYKGVLRIHVKESSHLLAYMKGLIEGLAVN